MVLISGISGGLFVHELWIEQIRLPQGGVIFWIRRISVEANDAWLIVMRDVFVNRGLMNAKTTFPVAKSFLNLREGLDAARNHSRSGSV